MAKQEDEARGPTQAQLVNLNESSRGDASRTSRKTYDSALNARWAKFAQAEDTSSDALKAQLLTSTFEVNNGLIGRFFMAMWDDLQNNHGKVYKLTKCACDTTTKALLLLVNDALTLAGKTKIDSLKNLVSLFAEIGARCLRIVFSSRDAFPQTQILSLNLGGGQKSLGTP